MNPTHYVWLLLAVILLVFAFNLVQLGLVIALGIIVYLAYLAWTTRNVPHDPRDY
jgi:hypothetical protein